MKHFIRYNYLDASAIVKILVDENDSNTIQQYFNKSGLFRITTLCLGEALGVLKTKHFYGKTISRKGYLNRAYLLSSWIRDKRVVVDDVNMGDPNIFAEVESIVKKHRVDISDAFQIVTVKRGKYSNFSGESQSILITSDQNLEKAARAEGIRVWNCSSTAPP